MTPAGRPSPAAPAGPPAAAAEQSPTLWYLTQALLILAVFALGYLFAQYLYVGVTEGQRTRIRAEALADALVNYKIRLGLGEKVQDARQELGGLKKDLAGLGEQHLKSVPDDQGEAKNEAREKWKQALARFDGLDRRLYDLRVVYEPTQADMVAILQLLASLAPPEKKAGESKTDGKPAEPAKPDGGKPAPEPTK